MYALRESYTINFNSWNNKIWFITKQWNTELLTELARREKEAGITPEAEVDLYMKATAIEADESSLITYYTLRVSMNLYYLDLPLPNQKYLSLDTCESQILSPKEPLR